MGHGCNKCLPTPTLCSQQRWTKGWATTVVRVRHVPICCKPLSQRPQPSLASALRNQASPSVAMLMERRTHSPPPPKRALEIMKTMSHHLRQIFVFRRIAPIQKQSNHFSVTPSARMMERLQSSLPTTACFISVCQEADCGTHVPCPHPRQPPTAETVAGSYPLQLGAAAQRFQRSL